MAGDYVDEYITMFEVLARRANMKLDDPANLRMFAQGLHRGLAERCIDIESPDTFAQWMHTAQRQQNIGCESSLFNMTAMETRYLILWKRISQN